MKITEKDIMDIADMSKLALTDEEVKSMTEDLQTIFHCFKKKLSNLDTDGVKPMEQVSSNQNIFRDDKFEHSLEQQEVLKNASVNEKGYFKVPRVMEGN